MEEDPENGKELLHSAHTNGMNECKSGKNAVVSAQHNLSHGRRPLCLVQRLRKCTLQESKVK